MKQIDIIRTYAQKRCLVVDDVPDARAQLKRILTDYGSKETDTVGNAEEAIDLCAKRQYDIVISDYNLGPGKSGQQLLEELRFHELLKHTAIFIMITAESATHYVLHALEYQPDDFLQKPINRESLRPRLDLALLKNEHLLPIKEALDARKIGRAISAAADIAQHPSKFQNDARKMLAELYLKNKQADDAEAVYALIDEERMPLWADIGLAQVYILRKEYEQAERRLIDVISDHSNCVEAQDLLAKVYELTHRGDQSQQTLMNAVKLSPHSASRQRELGRVSLSIDDENTSVLAYRSAVRHAKNSCHETPDDFVNLAQGLVRLAKKAHHESESKSLLTEAANSLTATTKRFEQHPIVMMRNKLVEAEMRDIEGNHSAAEKASDEALALHKSMRYSVIGNTSMQLCIDCAKAFMDRGFYDVGESILQQLAQFNDDNELTIKIDRLLRVPQTKEGIEYAASCNRKGIEYYDKGKLEQAVNAFREVLRELPNHIGLNLNLIQALIAKAKQTNLTQSEQELLSSSFLRIGKVHPSASYFKRYQYLDKRYQKLIHSAAAHS